MAHQGSLLVQDTRSGKSYEIPIENNCVPAQAFKAIKYESSSSPRRDKAANGLRVYDPGLVNTAVDTTEKTWVDASKGQILLRGYPLYELRHCGFEEIFHLCVWGCLPTRVELEGLRRSLADAMYDIPNNVFTTIESFPRSTHPLAIITAGLAAYIAAYPSTIPSYAGKTLYHANQAAVDAAIISTTAALAVVYGLVVTHLEGRSFVWPDRNQTFYYNLLLMMGKVDEASERPRREHLEAMCGWGSIIADHGQAASTFGLSVTASTLGDPISALISALMAAYGPLHFGAQEAAYTTMQQIGTPSNVPAYLERIKQGKERMHGFGHRSYKARDPRVVNATRILDSLGGEDSIPFYAVAKELERAVLNDEFFQKRNLQANADLYGQFAYVAMGWESYWSPAMVFLLRMPGLMSTWRDNMLSDKIILIRPTDVYVGSTEPKTIVRREEAERGPLTARL